MPLSSKQLVGVRFPPSLVRPPTLVRASYGLLVWVQVWFGLLLWFGPPSLFLLRVRLTVRHLILSEAIIGSNPIPVGVSHLLPPRILLCEGPDLFVYYYAKDPTCSYTTMRRTPDLRVCECLALRTSLLIYFVHLATLCVHRRPPLRAGKPS